MQPTLSVVRSAVQLQPWPWVPLLMLPEVSWIGVLAASLAVVLVWQAWSRIRHRVSYNLYKIPGPQPVPLNRNLHQVVGTDTLHKVR